MHHVKPSFHSVFGQVNSQSQMIELHTHSNHISVPALLVWEMKLQSGYVFELLSGIQKPGLDRGRFKQLP
jgi:hypothetical protein